MFQKGSRSQVQEQNNDMESNNQKKLKKAWSQEQNYVTISDDKSSTVISYGKGQQKKGEEDLEEKVQRM